MNQTIKKTANKIKSFCNCRGLMIPGNKKEEESPGLEKNINLECPGCKHSFWVSLPELLEGGKCPKCPKTWNAEGGE